MYDCFGDQKFVQISLDCFGRTCLVPSSRLTLRLQKKMSRRRKVGRSALQRVLSLLYLRVSCSLFYVAGSQSDQWLIFRLFAGDAETIAGVSGNEDVSTGVETDGQLRGRHIVVTGSLTPLDGHPSMMSLRLSTVEIGAGSCWSRHLMTVMFVFKSGVY